MSLFQGASAASHSPSPSHSGLIGWEQHNRTSDAVETYFECITTCSLEDGECVTRCVEQLRET